VKVKFLKYNDDGGSVWQYGRTSCKKSANTFPGRTPEPHGLEEVKYVASGTLVHDMAIG
jgi:hypothetical protein